MADSIRRRSNGTIDTDFYRGRAAQERALMKTEIGRRAVATVRLAFAEAARLATAWSLPGTAPMRVVRRAADLPRSAG
jgi:hypothetical protein